MTSQSLQISNELSLPLAVVTTTQAILATKRKGKSYTASVEAEEMLEVQQVIGVIDPTGAWWGIRSSPDGNSTGYPVVVFGGDHADAPLEYTSGKEMARAWIEHNFSAIWDVSSMDVEEQVQFTMDFCSECLRLNRSARHLFIDEADTYLPQQPTSKLQVRCRAVVARLIKQGGKNGCGVTIITQRSSAIDKNALSQIDLLIILRTSDPDDLASPVKRVQNLVSRDFADRVREEAPKLDIGEAFVASQEFDIAARVRIRERRTFNSGRTVRPGEVVIAPKVMAKIDAMKLGRQIAASVQKAQEESPEFLHAEIDRLKKQIANGVTDMGAMEDLQREQQELRERAEAAETLLRERNDKIADWQLFGEQLAAVLATMPAMALSCMPGKATAVDVMPPPPEPLPLASNLQFTRRSAPASIPDTKSTGNESLEARILRSLAEFAAIGRKMIPKSVLSAWAEARGGYFGNTLGKMRSAGQIEYPSPGMIALSALGAKMAPAITVPITPRAFFERVLQQAGSPGALEQRILLRLRQDFPDGLGREELSEAVSARGGYYGNILGKLKSAGFIEYPVPGQVRLQNWTVMK